MQSIDGSCLFWWAWLAFYVPPSERPAPQLTRKEPTGKAVDYWRSQIRPWQEEERRGRCGGVRSGSRLWLTESEGVKAADPFFSGPLRTQGSGSPSIVIYLRSAQQEHSRPTARRKTYSRSVTAASEFLYARVWPWHRNFEVTLAIFSGD